MTIVRLAVPERDAGAVAEIYRTSVEGSIISFEIDAPDAGTMGARISSTLERTPWIVAEEDGSVIGYAYAGAHRERAAYRWSVDISAYVHADARGRGVGKHLYGVLIPILARQGFVNVYAGITQPNEASVRLHEAIGMRLVGVYRGVGYKLGGWHDVAWYGMRLIAPTDPPDEPLSLPRLLASDPGLIERAGSRR
jgi:L-amino acid N-acyltransferase YncA